KMETTPPAEVTLGDLGALTLRGAVAYAARCARRLRPLFILPEDSGETREQMVAVDLAIEAAESYAQALSAHPLTPAVVRQAYVAAEETGDATHFAAYAAAHAVQAAAYASQARDHENQGVVMEVVAAAFGASRVLLANTPIEAVDTVRATLRADFDKLQELN